MYNFPTLLCEMSLLMIWFMGVLSPSQTLQAHPSWLLQEWVPAWHWVYQTFSLVF